MSTSELETAHEPTEPTQSQIFREHVENFVNELESISLSKHHILKYKSKRRKRRYYQMGLMAKLSYDTSEDELIRLMKNGGRTFLLDLVTCAPDEIRSIEKKLQTAMEIFRMSFGYYMDIIFGSAIAINGDNLRLGRLHNNCSVLEDQDDVITLTPDPKYLYTGFKEIIYVRNLLYYSPNLKLNDEILLGKEVHCKVIKKLKGNIAVTVLTTGLLNSHDYVQFPNHCYSLTGDQLSEMVSHEAENLENIDANFIVLTKIRSKRFLSTLRAKIDPVNKYEIIGSIDFEFVRYKMVDLIGIMKLIHYVWISDYFTESTSIQNYIMMEIIPICRFLKKPIIGLVPLEKCNEFKQFENHEFLSVIDTIFIQKSSWCNKYPLIVKKLMPIRDCHRDQNENLDALKETLTSYQSVVNFIIRAIKCLECQAIIIHAQCKKAAIAFSRPEIYCPVLVMLPVEIGSKRLNKDDVETSNDARFVAFAREFNLRRNLCCILYHPEEIKDKGIEDTTPIEYGICCGRKNGLLEAGDFVITLVIGKENEENVEYGIEYDVAKFQAFYLPPSKSTEKFKYSNM